MYYDILNGNLKNLFLRKILRDRTHTHTSKVSDSFEIKSVVKQDCVLAPTLFGIFFSMLLKRVFGSSSLGFKLHTRTDGNLHCARSSLC